MWENCCRGDREHSLRKIVARGYARQDPLLSPMDRLPERRRRFLDVGAADTC